MPEFGWAKLGDGAYGGRYGVVGGGAVPARAGGRAIRRDRRHLRAGAAMTTGIRFIEETPELVPRHEASFYGHIANRIGLNPFEYVPYIAPFGWLPAYPEWKYPSPWMAEQPLPPEVALLWRYEVMTAPPQAFAPFVRDLQVTSDKVIPLIPDFCGWACLGIISERAMLLLESLFPGASYFWPARIVSKDGTPIDRPMFHWVQRHQITFLDQEADDLEQERGATLPRVPLNGVTFQSFSNARAYYEILHNSALRAVLQTLPFWSGDLSCDQPVYRADTFRALKAAGLTGLREIRSTPARIETESYRINRGEFIAGVR
jgi:hypothetical protein